MTLPYIFQIGFNKCATTALSKLFQNSGYRSVHGNAKRTWRRLDPARRRISPQLIIDHNLRNGLPALTKYEAFYGFFDLCMPLADCNIENFRAYPSFARDYPQARFILNIRDKGDWLRSRLRHKDGWFLRYERRRLGLNRDGVIQTWSEDWDQHLAQVQEFFAAESDRLLVFDVDKTPVQELIDFCAGDYHLDASHWTRHRETDALASHFNWKDKQALDHAKVA